MDNKPPVQINQDPSTTSQTTRINEKRKEQKRKKKSEENIFSCVLFLFDFPWVRVLLLLCVCTCCVQMWNRILILFNNYERKKKIIVLFLFLFFFWQRNVIIPGKDFRWIYWFSCKIIGILLLKHSVIFNKAQKQGSCAYCHFLRREKNKDGIECHA